MSAYRSIGLLTAMVTIVEIAPLSAAVTAESDEQAVREAMARFHAALQDVFEGDVRPMNEIWSYADDVTYMGPNGGMQVGWDQVSEVWKSVASWKLGGEVTFEKMHLNVGSDLAIAAYLAVGDHPLDGRPRTFSIRTTSIFRKEDGRWKMIGHHTDRLPFLEDPQE